MPVAPFPRAWTPRPVNSVMLDQAQRRIDARERRRGDDARLKAPNVFPVATSGPIVNPWPAIRAIRRARGMAPDQACGFPDDLGCETQLYLGLAIRSIRPDLSIIATAEQCLAPAVDAVFFGRLLDIADNSEWAARNAHVITAAVGELRGKP